MELTFNNDTAFFSIKCSDFKDPKNADRLISEDVISFCVTEELGKITNGTLVLRDEHSVYSRLFRFGMQFQLSWGYFKPGSNLIAPTADIQGSMVRTGLKAIVINPSGEGQQGGESTYTVGFYSTEILSQRKIRVFSSGDKSDVIREVFRDLGIDDANMYIKMDSEEQNFRLSTENMVRQSENSFAFLRYLSSKWHCTLHLGYDTDGNKIGAFIHAKQGNSFMTSNFLKAKRLKSNKKLYYNYGDLSNVMSYTWQNHIGDSGQGFFIKMDYVTGTYIFQRYVAETQSVIVYSLNTQQIDEYASAHQENAVALTQEILNAESYNSRIGDRTVLSFFDKINETTAPDGMGYTVCCSMKGDPFISPMVSISFQENFTTELRLKTDLNLGVPLYFTVRKATHIFSKSGYFTEAEIVDSYILNSGFLEDTTPIQVVQ